MPISVMCPSCDAKLNAPDAAAGKTVKCPKCKAPMVVPEADAGFETVDDAETPKKSKPGVKKDVMLDDEPVSKKKRPRVEEDDDDEEEEERPRKKGKKKPAAAEMSPVIVAAIAGGVLLLAGGAFAVYWFGFHDAEVKPMVNNNSGPPPMPKMVNGPNIPALPGGGGPIVPGPKSGGENTPTPTSPPRAR